MKTLSRLVEPRIADRRISRMQRGDRFRLTAVGGLAALSLDALPSVAHGPEAIVLVLAAAVSWTLPVSCAITALLLVLVLSYRQVIAVHPDGGGAYAVHPRGPARVKPAQRPVKSAAFTR